MKLWREIKTKTDKCTSAPHANDEHCLPFEWILIENHDDCERRCKVSSTSIHLRLLLLSANKSNCVIVCIINSIRRNSSSFFTLKTLMMMNSERLEMFLLHPRGNRVVHGTYHKIRSLPANESTSFINKNVKLSFEEIEQHD